MNIVFMTLLAWIAFVMTFSMIVSAAPVDESIPEGLEGAASDIANPSDEQAIFLKLLLLKKLLFLG